MEDRVIEVSGGIRIAVRMSGDPSSPPMVLLHALGETGDDWAAALAMYAERRKPNADAIAELALDNFVEMRDKVASPVFRLSKRVEHAIERWAPDHYDSLYELVSFTTVPYAEARRRAAAQRRFPANVAALGAAGAARATDAVRKVVP